MPALRPASSNSTFRTLDRRISGWMAHYAPWLLRLALAVIFIWFGALKTIHASPANDLVKRTIYWLPPDVFLPFLGWWEVLIGVCLLFRPLLRAGLLLLALQLPGTFLPLVILPEICFESFPFRLTMEGQYIIKNLLIIGAALLVGGTVNPPAGNHPKV